MMTDMTDTVTPTQAESREGKMVVIKRDADGNPTVWCDPEIADLVAALNSGNLRTSASCSGHGYRPGRIMLADGRELFVARDQQDVECIEAAFPLDINGQTKAERDAWVHSNADTVKPTLKPCPFCGGAAERVEIGTDDGFGNQGGSVITCQTCQASSHVEFGRKENLESQWNTRAAQATQAAEIARLRGAGLTLLRECERNGVADNVLHGLIPEEKLRDGSGMCEGTKNLRRAMNEFRAVLSAQPSEQDDDDIPERIGKCENCDAIIRDGDKFVSYDDGVVICDACHSSSEQEGGE